VGRAQGQGVDQPRRVRRDVHQGGDFAREWSLRVKHKAPLGEMNWLG
jgi:hypothetical protein